MAIVTTRVEWASTTMEGHSAVFNIDPDERLMIELVGPEGNDMIIIDLTDPKNRNARISKAAEKILLHFGCSYAEQNEIARSIRQMVY